MAGSILPDEMLAGLRDIRLPDMAPGGLFSEIAAAVGLGLLVACALSFLLPFISRNTGKTTTSPQDQLTFISSLPEPEQSVALLHLIRRHDPEAAALLNDRIYRRDVFPAASELEQIVLKLEDGPYG